MDTNGTSMGMSPYEQFMMAEKTSRHRASGTSITALVLGSVGLVAGVTSWIFAPIYANARAKAAEAQNAGTASLLQQTASLLAAERAERVQGDITLNATINDTVSGSQQGTLSATQQAQLDAGDFAALQTEDGYVTFCVTEKHPREELDRIVEIVKSVK